MTDAQSDAEFELATAANNVPRRIECIGEISKRLMTISSFISGIFGGSNFPNYERRSAFIQSNSAQASAWSETKSAALVAKGIAKSVKDEVKGAAGGVGSVFTGIFQYAFFAIAAAGVIIYLVKKK